MRRRQQGIESPRASTAGAGRLRAIREAGALRPERRASLVPEGPAPRSRQHGASRRSSGPECLSHTHGCERNRRRSRLHLDVRRGVPLSAALDSRLEASHTGLDPRGAPLLRGCVRQPKQCSGAGLLSPVRAQVMLSRNSLTGTDVNEATLGRVPNAASATNAGTPTRWTASTRPPSSARTPRPAATSPAPTPTRPSPTAP